MRLHRNASSGSRVRAPWTLFELLMETRWEFSPCRHGGLADLRWFHQPQVLPHIRPTSRPGLLCLVGLLAVLIGVLLATSRRPGQHPAVAAAAEATVEELAAALNLASAEEEQHRSSYLTLPPPPSLDLRAAEEPPKLNSVEAAIAPPQPARLPPLVAIELKPPPDYNARSPASEEPRLMLPPRPPALETVRANESPFEPTPGLERPGETAMLSKTPPLPVQLLLAGWFFGLLPSGVAADEKGAAGEPADRFQQIERRIGDLETKLKQMEGLPKRLEAVENKAAAPADTKATDELGKRADSLDLRLKNLEEALLQLQKNTSEITKLRKELTEQGVDLERMKLRFNQPPATTTREKVGNGQIQLVNSWMKPVWVTLEGVDYLLRPGQTRTITRPPGPFNYEVHDVQGVRTSTLADDGRPHVIEIHPR